MSYIAIIDGEAKNFGNDRKRADKWLSEKMNEKRCSRHRMWAELRTTSISPLCNFHTIESYCFLPATGFPGDPGSWFVDEG